jgi:hypothetical protein
VHTFDHLPHQLADRMLSLAQRLPSTNPDTILLKEDVIARALG